MSKKRRQTHGSHQLSQTLPSAIVAALGVRDLARMCRYYPTAISTTEARQIHEGLVSAFEESYRNTGLPDLGDQYSRPQLGDPKIEEMMAVIIAILLLNHPDRDETKETEDEKKQQMEEMIREAQKNCHSPVRELTCRLKEIMVVDCQIPDPVDDPSFREPKRFLHLLHLYWQPCHDIVVSEMNSRMGSRPHKLLTLLVHLRNRILRCCNALDEHDEMASVVQAVTSLLDILIQGDLDDLTTVEEWTFQQLHTIEVGLAELRLKLGSGNYPLTHEEDIFLRQATALAAEYDVELRRASSATYEGAENGAAENAKAPVHPEKTMTTPVNTQATPGQTKSHLDLSITKCMILQAVKELGAKCEESKVGCAAIARQTKMAPDARLRTELAALRELQLLGGDKGTRGYWLTTVGLRQVSRDSSQ